MKFPVLDSTSVTQQWTREKKQQSDLPMDKFIAFSCKTQNVLSFFSQLQFSDITEKRNAFKKFFPVVFSVNFLLFYIFMKPQLLI